MAYTECFECGGSCCEMPLEMSPVVFLWEKECIQKLRDEHIPLYPILYRGQKAYAIQNSASRCEVFSSGRCSIYDRRPIMCRSYPAEPFQNAIVVNGWECPAVQKLVRVISESNKSSLFIAEDFDGTLIDVKTAYLVGAAVLAKFPFLSDAVMEGYNYRRSLSGERLNKKIPIICGVYNPAR